MLWPINQPPPGPEGTDKLVHLIALAALAFQLARTGRTGLVPVFLGASAFGGIIGVIQPSFGSSAELQRLEGAYAPNTLKFYYADTNAFVYWCIEKNVEPFPLKSERMREYIEAMAMSNSYASIRRRLSCQRRINKLLGYQDHTHTEEVYLTIRRLKRSKCLEQQKAVGINHTLLVKMIDAQPDTLTGIRNKAMLSLGYDFLARRSELVALRTTDIGFTKDGALKGMIRKSKTDQYGRSRLVFGSERSAKLLRAWNRKKTERN